MSNSKGSIGQAFIVAHLLERGYNVLVPVSEGLPYDIVVEHAGVYRRVQCKYRTSENGSIRVPKTNNDYRGVGTITYSRDNIDGFAIYCPDNRNVYFVTIAELDGVSKHLTLRITQSRNNQSVGVRSAERYTDPALLFDVAPEAS